MDRKNLKSLCSICEKHTRTFSCKGCSKEFCRNDLAQHFDTLDKQLDQVTNEHNDIVQKIAIHKSTPDKSPLLDKINEWEQNSIEKIRHIAREYRNELVKTAKRSIDQVENQLEDLGKQIKRIRQENDFNEIDLKEYQENLKQLDEKFENPANTLIRRSTSLLDRIPLSLSFHKNSKWKQNGVLIARGPELKGPSSICISDDQIIYVADRGHDRIMEWKVNSKRFRTVAGDKKPGNALNQLKMPNDVVIDKETNSLIIADLGNRRIMRWSLSENTQAGEILIPNVNCSNLTIDQEGSIYVSDSSKHEVRRWKKGEQEGTIVAGGNGQGRQLNQLNNPTYLFIDHEYSLYITDKQNYRIMKWAKDAKEGIVVAGNGSAVRNEINLYSEPSGIYVDRFNQVYVADIIKNRIVRWCEDEKQGCVILAADSHAYTAVDYDSIANFIFDNEGNLYVIDYANDLLLKFELDFD